MRVVIQRVHSASVKVNNEVVGEINNGLLLLICFEIDDTEENVIKAVKKISNMRIFANPEDETPSMTFNISQVQGSILSISQFTLSWNGLKGNRPSFDKSMPPERANELYINLNSQMRLLGLKVAEGRFGEQMDVSLINDGPVTFSLEF
ncbi:MAG: D-tyrosyl-tRNA(Tyr) deacylase [Thermoproteota archaeon]|jgi:D-tyrosyl-tRNA(Tyr) deacylase